MTAASDEKPDVPRLPDDAIAALHEAHLAVATVDELIDALRAKGLTFAAVVETPGGYAVFWSQLGGGVAAAISGLARAFVAQIRAACACRMSEEIARRVTAAADEAAGAAIFAGDPRLN